MKKFILAIFLAVIALTSIVAVNISHASAATTISIDSSTQQFPSATVGSTIQVNIEISNVQGLWAWDIGNFTFNPAYLNITDVSKGPFLQKAGQDLFIWSSNTPTWYAIGIIPDMADTLLSYNTESGSGVLATLTFTVLSLGSTQINFTRTTLDSDKNIGTSTDPIFQTIPCTNINANISLGPVTATPTPTTNPTSSPADSPSSSSSPTASSPSTDSTSTPDSSPTPTPKMQQAPEFPAFSIIMLLIIAATASTLLLTRKAKHNKK